MEHGDTLMALSLLAARVLTSISLEASVHSTSTEGAVQWSQLESTHV